MNSSNLKLAGKGERICRSICAHCSRWGNHWLELLPPVSVDCCEYKRFPGERLPPPPSSGPQQDIRRKDWELAA